MAKKKSDAEDEEAGGGKKKLIMGVVGLLALGGVYNFVLKPAPADPELLALMEEAEPVEGEIFELPEMVINLSDDAVTYLRVGVALILEEGTPAADFETEAAIAKDVVLDDLSSRSAAELRDSASKQRVKEELSAKVRAAYDDEKVVRVLFTALVMQ